MNTFGGAESSRQNDRTIRNWAGAEIEVGLSKGGTLAVADPKDNLVRGGVTPWPPPEIVQKLYQSRQVRAFLGVDRERVTKRLGFYSDLQSLHSEDALTWSVFGPIAHASNSVKSRFVQSLLDTIKVPVSSVGDVSVRLWRRLAHPDTLVPGGPEIDFGIRTEDLVVLGEAKWLSAVGGKQGKKRDKDQIVFVILMAAPNSRIDRPPSRGSTRAWSLRRTRLWMRSARGLMTHPCWMRSPP